MTFAIFILLTFGLFIGLLNILPTADALPSGIDNAFGYVIKTMKAWDFLFPITEMLTLTLIVIIIEVALWNWGVAWKIVKFVRGHADGA